MNSNLLIVLELSLVFLVVFGWGFNELRQLKKHNKALQKQEDDSAADD